MIKEKINTNINRLFRGLLIFVLSLLMSCDLKGPASFKMPTWFFDLMFPLVKQKYSLEGMVDNKQIFSTPDSLGMQLMFESGSENGEEAGIGLFKGRCEEFTNRNEIKLPHIGFNLVSHSKSKIWKDIPNNSPFYFVHSYRIINDKKNYGKNENVSSILY